MSGRLTLRLSPGSLSGPAPGGDPFRLAWREAGASAVLEGARLQAQARMLLAEGAGRLRLRLRAPRAGLPPPLGPSAGSWAGAPLTGRVEVALRDLGPLAPFLPVLEDPHGRLQGRLALGGRVGAPRLRGRLRLEEGSAGLPDLGIRVSGADLVLEAPGEGSLRLQGSLRSEGPLRLEGQGRWPPDGPPEARLRLQGRRVLLARLPELELYASPDLRLSLRGREVTLDGELEVPRARLRPERMTLAVEPSPDVSVSGRARPPARWQLRARLLLRLGEDVRFQGYGLRARLAGNLALLEEPGRPPSGAGVLQISEGRYRAYGQRLGIDDGKLLFYGGPVDDPGLDLRAVRQVEDLTVGVRLAGRLRRPQATLFSVPPLPQTEVLSYLVLGHGTEGSTTAEGRRLQRAAAALGLAGGGLLAEQLGRRLGLGELRLETGAGFGQGALVLRRYLGPRLYLSYGVGLFQRFSAFVLRYRLSTLWSLEARSGLERGADLLYELESH